MAPSRLLLAGLLAAAPALPAGAHDWRTADRSSAGLAPSAAGEPRAVVQVYAARAIHWRGWFAVHSWISVKEAGADSWEVLHVVGWRLRRGHDVVVRETAIPDRRWYGAMPRIVAELRGAPAAAAIPKIRAAADAYPYHRAYRIWPGPNSNTFVSHVLRSVPELRVELPPHAIGRDWLGGGRLLARSETGTGFQLSLFGMLGLTLGLGEGVEVNVLGLSFGADLLRPALKLPLLGRLGLPDAPPPFTRAPQPAPAAPAPAPRDTPGVAAASK